MVDYEIMLQILLFLEMFLIFSTYKFGSKKIVSLFNNKNIYPFFYLFHLSIVLFISFGFLLPKHLLPYHIILVLLLLFHWKINDNSCIVTQIQEELAGSKDTSFTHNLFKRIGIEIPDGFDVAYFINSLAILLSTMRLLN